MKWTEQELSKLRELHGEGYTAAQIAGVLGCTRNSVVGKAYRLGLRRVEKTLSGAAAVKHTLAAKKFVKYVPKRHDAFGTAKTLLDLGYQECRWPINDAIPYLFCAAHAPGGVYCAAHQAMSRSKKQEIEVTEDEIQGHADD